MAMASVGLLASCSGGSGSDHLLGKKDKDGMTRVQVPTEEFMREQSHGSIKGTGEDGPSEEETLKELEGNSGLLPQKDGSDGSNQSAGDGQGDQSQYGDAPPSDEEGGLGHSVEGSSFMQGDVAMREGEKLPYDADMAQEQPANPDADFQNLERKLRLKVDEKLWEEAARLPHPKIEELERRYEGGLFGFRKKDGEVAIPPSFPFARRFSGGFAAIKEAGGWGFIDSTGKKILPATNLMASSFKNGRAWVIDEQGMLRVIDSMGRTLSRARLEMIKDLSAWMRVDNPSFPQGKYYIATIHDGRGEAFSLINTMIIVDAKLRPVSLPFEDAFAVKGKVFVAHKLSSPYGGDDGKAQIIDFGAGDPLSSRANPAHHTVNGIIRLQSSSVGPLNVHFGYAPERVAIIDGKETEIPSATFRGVADGQNRRVGKYLVLDVDYTRGEMGYPYKQLTMDFFDNPKSEDRKWYEADTVKDPAVFECNRETLEINGEKCPMVEIGFDDAGEIVAPSESVKKWCFVNGDGKVFDFKGYSSIKLADCDNNPDMPGAVNFHAFSNGYATVMKDGKWGVVDKNMKTVIPFKWDDLGQVSRGLIPFKEKGKWGYMTMDGTMKIPPIYDKAESFMHSAPVAKVGLKGETTYIDIDGAPIFPFSKDEIITYNGTDFIYNNEKNRKGGPLVSMILDARGEPVDGKPLFHN